MSTRRQVRLYTIRDGKMDEWLEGWTKGVVPLREAFGFHVEGSWVAREANRFLWILRYDGSEGFETRDAEYYASPERHALRPDPAPLVARAETFFVDPVLRE